MSAFALFTAQSPEPIPAESLQTALLAACQMIQGGEVVLRITGAQGFVMERSDIELECARRRDRSATK